MNQKEAELFWLESGPGGSLKLWLGGLASPSTAAREAPPNLRIPAQKSLISGFPGASVGKNPPASAGDGFHPCTGKTPHDTQQLSPCATRVEPVAPLREPRIGARALQRRSHRGDV